MESLDTSEFGQRRRRVVIGVGGGIAAYKACALIRAFTESLRTEDASEGIQAFFQKRPAEFKGR